MNCLETGLEVLAVVVWDTVDFEELTLDIAGFEGTTLTVFVLGLNGVALGSVTLGLADVFLAVVGCGFFGTASWSDKEESGFVLEGLVLVVAGTVDFFLLPIPVIVFLELAWGVGFARIGLESFGFEALEVNGRRVGGFVGGDLVLSGAVTDSVLGLEGGETKPTWTVTGITVPKRCVDMVPWLGFIVWVGATYLTADAAAATPLARLNFVDFLGISWLPRLGVAAVAVMFVSCGKIGSKGERFGLYVSASLHCFLTYLQKLWAACAEGTRSNWQMAPSKCGEVCCGLVRPSKKEPWSSGDSPSSLSHPKSAWTLCSPQEAYRVTLCPLIPTASWCHWPSWGSMGSATEVFGPVCRTRFPGTSCRPSRSFLRLESTVKRKALLTRCERTLRTSARLDQMAAGKTEPSGASICARWLSIIPDLNGITPAGPERDGFSPLSPSFWRMSTSE